MKKGKRFLALILAFTAFVLFASTDLAGLGRITKANAATKASNDFKMQEFRVQTENDAQATTGTGYINRVSDKRVYLAVRTSKDFTDTDFPGTFYFYWTETSGSRDRDESTFLGTAHAMKYSQAKTEYPDFKGNWNIGDDVAVIICDATVDVSDPNVYSVGDAFYFWVYYDSEGKGSIASKESQNERKIVIKASTVVKMNSIDSVVKGNDAEISAKITSEFGVEEGTVHFYIGDKEIGRTDVTLSDETGDKGTVIKGGTGTITVPTTDMDAATHKVYAIFEPKDKTFPNSQKSSDANLTITQAAVTNDPPEITDKNYDDSETRDPVDVTFKVSDDKDVKNLTIKIEVKDEAGKLIEFTRNETGDTISFKATQNGVYDIEVTDEEGAQAFDSVVIDNIKEDNAPDITDITRDFDVPGTGKLTAAIKDDYTEFNNLTISVTDSDGNPISIEKAGDAGDTHLGTISFSVSKSGVIIITATDDRGQTTVQNLKVEIPSQPPVISNDAQDKDTDSGNVKVTFNVTDPDTDYKDLKVTVTDPDGRNIPVTPDADGKCSFDASKSGTYTVTAEDDAGNKTAPYPIEVTVDTTVNHPPVVNVKTPGTDKTPGPVNVEFTINDDTTEVKDLTVEVKDSSGKEIANVTRNDGDCSFAVTENGTYTITVTDKDGSKTTKEVVISNIDKTQTPTQPSTQPGNTDNGDDGSDDSDDGERPTQAPAPQIPQPTPAPTQPAVKPSEKPEESVSPQTSDNARTGVYAAICAAAALILAAGTAFSRKKN